VTDKLDARQERVKSNVELTNKKMLGGITGKGFMPGKSGFEGRHHEKPITKIYEELLAEGMTREDIKKSMRAMIRSRSSVAVQAVREIADRVEGKATERIEHTGADGAPLAIAVMLVKPEAQS